MPTTPRRSVARRWLAGAVATELVLAVVLFDGHQFGAGYLGEQRLYPLLGVPMVAAVVALAVAELDRRSAAWLILGVTAALQVIALTQSPTTSNDDLRYIWDGKVQLAGIDPYRYAPIDDHLASLREPPMFGAPAQCLSSDGCPHINKATVHTIYPPVAQAAFVGVRILSFGGHGGQLTFQATAALGVLAITLLLLRRARQRGDPVWWSALWGWSPIVVSEFGNNAHIDWLAVLLSLGAIGAYVALRPVWAGALLGAAIATKLYPVLLGPVLIRRHPWRVMSAALGVVVVGYLPHVAAVGTDVLGYLPGYLNEEGYASGSRLVLIGIFVPRPFDSVVGVVLLGLLALWCLRTVNPNRPELSAVWLVGAAFLIISPNYGWYAALLVALVAMTGRWYWLPVALAPTLTYLYGHTTYGDSLVYAGAATGTALLAGLSWWLECPSVRV